MSFFCRLSRRHYWCTPHRSADNRLVQVCYECGAERPAREFHKEFDFIQERSSTPRSSTLSEARRRQLQSSSEVAREAGERRERATVGRRPVRKFAAG
jgi:hypothetical protein